MGFGNLLRAGVSALVSKSARKWVQEGLFDVRANAYAPNHCSYYSFAFAASIIQTEGATVVNVYFIIRSILYTSLYPADIFLLLTVYTLLLHCFSMPGDDPKRNLKRNIFTAHCVFLGVLGALYLAALALGIERVVKTAGYAYAEYVYYDGTVPTVNKVDFAFTALCFVTSVEVLIATVFIAATARKRELPASVRWSL